MPEPCAARICEDVWYERWSQVEYPPGAIFCLPKGSGATYIFLWLQFHSVLSVHS